MKIKFKSKKIPIPAKKNQADTAPNADAPWQEVDALVNPYRIDPEVVEGREGQLFISAGNHRIEEYLLGRLQVEESSFRNFDENLSSRRKLTESIGARFVHIVCPDKQTICAEHYPLRPAVTLGRLYKERCKEPFLYPVEELRAPGPTQTYFKTDSHWNFEGSFIATQCILRELGVQGAGELLDRRRALPFKKEFSGDLGSKLEPNLSEETLYYEEIHEKIRFSNEFTKNNGMIRITVNPMAESNTRLLIFGDSFLNGCLSALTDFFRYTIFVRTPYLHQELLFSFRPTHVITGNVERYLARTSSDEAAENCFFLALLRGLDFDHQNKLYPALSALTGRNQTKLEQIVLDHIQSLIKSQRLEAARNSLSGWLRHQPLSERALILQSMLAAASGDLAQAVEKALQAVEQFDRTPGGLNHAGAILLKVERNEEALELFSEAVSKFSLSPVAHRGKAMALQRVGRLQEAIAAAELAVEISKGADVFVKYRDQLRDKAQESSARAARR